MDKTVKISAYGAPAKAVGPQETPVLDRIAALELEQKQAQLEEERNKSLELLRNVVQLRESLKQEQTKTAELSAKVEQLEDKLKELETLEDSQIAKHNAHIEEEKKYSRELMRTIEQLREDIRQEKSKSLEIAHSGVELEAKLVEIADLEARIKELTATFGKIISIAEAAKAIADK
jgi:predicted RNase H-like nuclease (RuvC/YqgF family)